MFGLFRKRQEFRVVSEMELDGTLIYTIQRHNEYLGGYVSVSPPYVDKKLACEDMLNRKRQWEYGSKVEDCNCIKKGE